MQKYGRERRNKKENKKDVEKIEELVWWPDNWVENTGRNAKKGQLKNAGMDGNCGSRKACGRNR